jgi:cytochrome c553
MSLRRKGLIAGGVLGFVVLFWLAAPYNIAASVPHLPGVSWLLNGYMKNAVRTWSLGAPEPPPEIDLEDDALAALGAGHFESGCAPCHGAPGRARNPVVLGQRPNPPTLQGPAAGYADRELWWIVRNGFKYTAMPAWPAQLRKDEPWALAAFLRRLPELEAEAYRELAYGGVEPRGLGEAMSFGGLNARLTGAFENCARCHGVDGRGREGAAPRLAGQSEAYLKWTLDAYAAGARASGFMQPQAAALNEAQRAELAARFAALPPGPPAPAVDPALVARGRALAETGDPGDEVPACLACHGGEEMREGFPRIRGQHRRWLETWLRLWRDMQLGGTRYAGLMHEAAKDLTDPQITALAAYFAQAEPASRLAERDGFRAAGRD